MTDGPPPPPRAATAADAGMSARERLAREPGRFDADQAAAVAAHGGAGLEAVRFRSLARLSHAEGEVAAADPEGRTLTLTGFGLLGVGGALPRHHTATVAGELRKRSAALHAFVDLLGGRFAGLFARAGAKYRPTRDPAPAERALRAAVGLGTGGGLAERAGAPVPALLYHAGHLAARTRSAERLRAMLEEECGGWPVAVGEFAGGWLRLPPSEQTRLGGGGRLAVGAHSALGAGATAGAQVWDAGARFEVRVGPLDRAAFEALLPGRPLHARLVALARLSVGPDTAFAIRPVLAARAVPPLRLAPRRRDAAAGGEGARLGWTSWLGTAPGRPRTRDGDEAAFEAR